MSVIGISLLTSLLRGDIYTDHQGTDDQCALMISVAPSMPHISAHLSCLLVAPISASQCCLSVPSVLPISAAYQCHI
ncbi:unnamed protein product [Staurois parvus]|uniref:Uncharacterized protein n=1 Tax=Staurois parvus TaxID=386267 RepID=A0ABN9BM90_9NEOB|nr:unnamed protein product [Staurois parvus]CAI9598401.1 unnamed protein product [Staurois parvus]